MYGDVFQTDTYSYMRKETEHRNMGQESKMDVGSYMAIAYDLPYFYIHQTIHE